MTKSIRLAILAVFCGFLSLGLVHFAHADAGPDAPLIDAAPTAAPTAVAAPAPTLPDPVAAPGESVGLLSKLYREGHLIPMFVVLGFFVLVVLEKKIGWLRQGYRKVVTASLLGGLTMLAERAASGTTPNMSMTMGALGVALALALKTYGEPAPTPSPQG